MLSYTVENMRFVRPSKVVADRNPDRFGTVKGTAFRDPDGNVLSIKSKEITLDMARDPNTVIDLVNGTLTIPSGERGRKRAESISQDDLLAELEAIRNSEPAE